MKSRSAPLSLIVDYIEIATGPSAGMVSAFVVDRSGVQVKAFGAINYTQLHDLKKNVNVPGYLDRLEVHLAEEWKAKARNRFWDWLLRRKIRVY